MADPDSESSDTGQWARAVDQPGFQDNVSAHNVLSLMLRAQIPEVGACAPHAVSVVSW